MNTVTSIVQLSDTELDMVAAGTTVSNSLVNLNNLVSINVGVQVANQQNIALFSIAQQGGGQLLSLNQVALNFVHH
jgi:hypothetical protein